MAEMELNLVSASYRATEPILTNTINTTEPEQENPLRSAEDALDALKQQPGYSRLAGILRFLDSSGSTGFDVAKPGPQSAQIIQVLVTDIVPNYWALLREEAQDGSISRSRGDSSASDLSRLLNCLQSLAGVSAIIVRLRALILEMKADKKVNQGRSHQSLAIQTTLDLLGLLLRDESSVHQIWQSIATDDTRRNPLTQELLAVLGGGRLLAVAAEAEDLQGDGQRHWVADAQQYVPWIGRNIAYAIGNGPSEQEHKFFSALFAKSLRLGHSETLVKLLLQNLLLQQDSDSATFTSLLDGVSFMEQRKVVSMLMKILSDAHLSRLGPCKSDQSKTTISAVAGVLNALVNNSPSRKEHLVSWLTSPSGAGLGEGIGIRRSALAAVAQETDQLSLVLEKSMSQFGDELYIKHASILQQEAHAQVLLLAAGYSHRLKRSPLAILMRSSIWLNAVSNRLAATHQRARILGMIVGEALSGLVDSQEKKLDFHTEETNSDEAQWYKGLTQVHDTVGSFSSLAEPEPVHVSKGQAEKQPEARKPVTKARPPIAAKPPARGFIIEEVEGSDEDEDLVGYAKPGSDADDSDDDPTLIQRNKPKAPVYVRDLIRYLRDTDSYDHQRLALTTAPTLIRRKASHGTEVSEHAEEVAALLIGLQDKFDMDDFYDLRLQGMLAIVSAQPRTMGLWFAKTFFDGDYSISQRAAILITLGLSAREIAGFDTSEYSQGAAFPSKTLPEGVAKLYLQESPTSNSMPSNLKPLPPNALDTISNSLASSFVAPLLANAADKDIGPDALKLSTFASQLNASKVKYKTRTKPRTRVIANTTAEIISTSYFTPLTARFRAALHSTASRTRGILFNSHLLALYLKTLGILLHAAGPSTLALPDMTAELWAVLLSSGVRTQCLEDLGATRAAMFALLALLEVNEDRMRDICQDMGKEVVETQEWVASVFGRIRGGDGQGGEEDEAKSLAAAVLVRLKEGVDKYQLLLAGDLIG